MTQALISLYPMLRMLWEVSFFLMFIAILAQVFRPSRNHDFEQAAQIPLRDDLSRAFPDDAA